MRYLNTPIKKKIFQFWALPIQQQNKNMTSKKWTNGVQLSDSAENVGKGEIARYEQFLLAQCFQKLSVIDENEYLWGKGLKHEG